MAAALPSDRWLARVVRFTFFAVVYLLAALTVLWAAAALWFDLPVSAPWRKGLAAAFFLGVITLWWVLPRSKILLGLLPSALVAVWWFSLQPKANRPWQPNVAETAWAEIEGDAVTFHNVRNFDYHADGTFTPRWETRTIHLSQITGLDLAINYWGSPYMAHPIASFQFSDSPPLCFSIETRREIGEDYSALGGFYRQYELIYIVADERDVIRVRTNYNKNEDIYLYRMTLPPEKVRERFLEYVGALNQLHDHPRWYNAARANCTTSIRTQQNASGRMPWDWRVLVNGYGDEMLYERGSLRTGGLSFPELKSRALIDDLARAANDDPDFSTRIRAHLPP